MKSIVHFVAATAAIGALAAPAAAQYAPQVYPQYQQPGYPAYGQQPAPAPGQPGYAYTQQGYAQPARRQPSADAAVPQRRFRGYIRAWDWPTPSARLAAERSRART